MASKRDIRVGRKLLLVAPRLLRAETNLLAARDIPLTHRQYRILKRISTGMTSQTALSKAAWISVAAISESIDALMRRGLLDRTADQRDRRAIKLSLTEEGEQAVKAADQVLDEMAATVMAGFDRETVLALEKVLEVLDTAVMNDLVRAMEKR